MKNFARPSIQFTPKHPIPAALVKKIVKARIEENMSKYNKK
ncbi:MAG TPA: hypothetical protein VJH34_02680 [archaeon]|nr:hypothetical protein [archaeon]